MIVISVFKAAIPFVEPELLPTEVASSCLDCDLERGSLAPAKGDLLLSDPINSDTQTVYHTGNKLYQWPGIVDIAKTFDDIDSRRILFTDGVYPKETDVDLGDTGSGPWPADYRRNGLPAPGDAPGIVIGGTAEEDERGRYSWVYTYLYTRPDGSEIESAPSSPTAVTTWMEGETVTLTGFAYPDPEVEGCSYTGIRIYRIQATETGASYHFVREQTDLSDWLDEVSDLEATDNAILETMNTSTGSPVSWDMPVDELRGITKVDAGFFLGFAGNKVYLSPIFIGFAFPGKYSLAADSKVKGFGYVDSIIVVATEENPYLIIGSDPASVSFKRLNYCRPCIGEHRSIVSAPGGVLYPSSEGFILIDSTGADTVITENILTVDQWRALNPENFISFLYRGKLVCLEAGSTNIHIIDIGKGRYEKAKTSGSIRGAYQGNTDGSIFIVVDNIYGREIRKWRGLWEYTNRALWSEDISNAAWDGYEANVSGPNKFTATLAWGGVYQDINTKDGVLYTCSFVASVPEGAQLTGYYIYHLQSDTGNITPLPISTIPTRYSATVLSRSGGGVVGFGIADGNVSDWAEITVTDFQVTETPFDMPYVKTEDSPVYVYPKDLLWISKVFDEGSKEFYSRAVVRGDFSGGKTLTVTLIADGVDRTPIVITSAGMFNTGRFWANKVQVKLSGTAKVKTFILGGSPSEVLGRAVLDE